MSMALNASSDRFQQSKGMDQKCKPQVHAQLTARHFVSAHTYRTDKIPWTFSNCLKSRKSCTKNGKHKKRGGKTEKHQASLPPHGFKTNRRAANHNTRIFELFSGCRNQHVAWMTQNKTNHRSSLKSWSTCVFGEREHDVKLHSCLDHGSKRWLHFWFRYRHVLWLNLRSFAHRINDILCFLMLHSWSSVGSASWRLTARFFFGSPSLTLGKCLELASWAPHSHAAVSSHRKHWSVQQKCIAAVIS